MICALPGRPEREGQELAEAVEVVSLEDWKQPRVMVQPDSFTFSAKATPKRTGLPAFEACG